MGDAWAEFGTALADWLTPPVLGASVAAAAWLAFAAANQLAASISSRRSAAIPLLALAFSVSTSGVPSKADERRSVPPSRVPAGSPPPWTGPEGSPSSSPLPVPATDERDATAGDVDGPVAGADVQPRIPEGSHPALHGRTGGTIVPLFPRAPKRAVDPDVRRREREDAMRRHPAGKGVRSDAPSAVPGSSGGGPKPASAEDEAETARRYTVRPGDTLWAIAASHLETADVRRIARYWPLIHKANSALVTDPSLIQPGWRLVLPPETH